MAANPLPSWNEGKSKQAIIDFVTAVAKGGSKDYVPPRERIASFDNDGTLWVEYPMSTQALFVFDREKQLASQHLEWKSKQPFKEVLERDMAAVGATGMEGVMDIFLATHSGMTATEFSQQASSWLATTKQQRFDRLYQ